MFKLKVTYKDDTEKILELDDKHREDVEKFIKIDMARYPCYILSCSNCSLRGSDSCSYFYTRGNTKSLEILEILKPEEDKEVSILKMKEDVEYLSKERVYKMSAQKFYVKQEDSGAFTEFEGVVDLTAKVFTKIIKAKTITGYLYFYKNKGSNRILVQGSKCSDFHALFKGPKFELIETFEHTLLIK